MSSHSIRILSAALVVFFILTGLALPGYSGQSADPQNIKPQFILPQMFPDKTALELMQLGKDMVERKKTEARLKAGEKIEYGGLRVTSQPEGAGVLVSSYVPLGKTPYTNQKLLPGLQRVTVRKDGYYEQVRMVEIKPNQQSALDFKLKPIPYVRLTVKVRPPTTKVKIVDVEEPYTPGMKLAPGQYLVSLRHPMYGDKRLYVVLTDNDEVTLNGDLAAWTGRIEVDSTPSDATVYVDGREEGRTPFSSGLVRLAPGPHLVQVFKSLFKPVSKIVQVRSQETTAIKINLPPADHFTNSVGMEFVKIPAGKFMMGLNSSPEYLTERILEKTGDPLNNGDLINQFMFRDYPQHLVEITTPFFVQTTEVTNGQWDKVMGTKTPHEEALKPKVSVSVKAVKEFIAKLNEIDKGEYVYRLPTEAEWEYAARANTKSLYYFGDEITTRNANFDGDIGFPACWSFGPSLVKTVNVKSYAPNPWGLYDMYGNASELCADWFDGFYYTYSPIKDPLRLPEGDGNYAGRGGSAFTGWTSLMSGQRGMAGKLPVSGEDPISGFRLVAEKVSSR